MKLGRRHLPLALALLAVSPVAQGLQPANASSRRSHRATHRPDVRALQARAEELAQELHVAKESGDDRRAQELNAELAEMSARLEEEMARLRLQPLRDPFRLPARLPDLARLTLRRGDILLVSYRTQPVQGFLWALRFAHCGTYDGNGWVYEAEVGKGAHRTRLEEWKRLDGVVLVVRNRARAQAEVERALDWAKVRYGTNGRTPYNFCFWDLATEERLYCSQLVWKIHRRAGVDLNSNPPRYLAWFRAKWGQWLTEHVARPAVAPDEIALSPDVGMVDG